MWLGEWGKVDSVNNGVLLVAWTTAVEREEENLGFGRYERLCLYRCGQD